MADRGADLAVVYGGMYATPSQPLHDHQYILYPPKQGPPDYSREKSFDADIEYLHACQARQQHVDDPGAASESDGASIRRHMMQWVAANRAKWIDAFLLLVIVVLSVLMIDAIYQRQQYYYAAVTPS